LTINVRLMGRRELTWRLSRCLQRNPYLQFAGSFIGDYTGTAVSADHEALTVWTDDRGNPGVTPPNQDAVVATGL